MPVWPCWPWPSTARKDRHCESARSRRPMRFPSDTWSRSCSSSRRRTRCQHSRCVGRLSPGSFTGPDCTQRGPVRDRRAGRPSARIHPREAPCGADPCPGLGSCPRRGARRSRPYYHRRARRANLAPRMDDLKWIPNLPVSAMQRKKTDGESSPCSGGGIGRISRKCCNCPIPVVVRQFQDRTGTFTCFPG